jgi:hypothetical protein
MGEITPSIGECGHTLKKGNFVYQKNSGTAEVKWDKPRFSALCVSALVRQLPATNEPSKCLICAEGRLLAWLIEGLL